MFLQCLPDFVCSQLDIWHYDFVCGSCFFLFCARFLLLNAAWIWLVGYPSFRKASLSEASSSVRRMNHCVRGFRMDFNFAGLWCDNVWR